MSKNKEFRELQFSSTQLVFVFLAILVLGVFVFLLGVSVGKKQGQLTAEAAIPGQLKAEKVAQKTPLAAEPGAADIQKELQSHERSKQEAAKLGSKPEAKQATESPKLGLKKEAPSAKDQLAENKAAAAVKKPAETKAKPETEKPAAKAAESKAGFQFFIQAGAFADKVAAAAFGKKLESGGFPAFVLDPLPTDKKAVCRVRIGPFGTKEEAEASRIKLADFLKQKKTDFFIVR